MGTDIKNVRNFWIDCEVDGRRSDVKTGPVGRGGGFVLEILQRNKGKVEDGVTVTGVADGDELILTVAVGGKCVFEHKTER